jgi:hypothetical protein
LEHVITDLENIYPYFQELLSSSPTPQLNRYVISLFGILQIILRAPPFEPEFANPRNYTVHGTQLDQILFNQCFKFAQVSDETAKEFIDDPESTLDDSPETLNRVAVRTAILSFAMEHFRVSYVEIWSRTPAEKYVDYNVTNTVGERRKRYTFSFLRSHPVTLKRNINPFSKIWRFKSAMPIRQVNLIPSSLRLPLPRDSILQIIQTALNSIRSLCSTPHPRNFNSSKSSLSQL